MKGFGNAWIQKGTKIDLIKFLVKKKLDFEFK